MLSGALYTSFTFEITNSDFFNAVKLICSDKHLLRLLNKFKFDLSLKTQTVLLFYQTCASKTINLNFK